MLGPMNEDDDIDEVRCIYCREEGLHWGDHYKADGTQDRRLFNARNRLHQCAGPRLNPDDFQQVSE